ncbi:MAG TPA: zinc ABC transporter substrate-binding protein [Geminicoccaceae bacterium]|nr:zinc ABC transporter substrate-binding protein [Geminicoccaceae bacterium]
MLPRTLQERQERVRPRRVTSMAGATRRGILGCLVAVPLYALSPARAGEPLEVVTTISQLADAAQRIGGERVRVRSLMGEGVDPHTYRQTRSDILALHRADLVLWNGLYLEAQMEGLLREMGEGKAVVAVAETLPPKLLLSHPAFPGKHDPHVWMDVALWSRVVAAVRDALAAADADGRDLYATNAAAYLAELQALDAYARRVLASVPEDERIVISAHDAFGYFGRAYGYEVIGIQGLSTESEAGLAQVERLVELIVGRGIKAVFVETSVAERNVRALVEGAAARGHSVAIGGALFSDAMGAPGTYEGTYVGMIDHNVSVIARALGGAVPEGGLNGRLHLPS